MKLSEAGSRFSTTFDLQRGSMNVELGEKQNESDSIDSLVISRLTAVPPTYSREISGPADVRENPRTAMLELNGIAQVRSDGEEKVNKTILVIDDDDAMLLYYKTVLARFGEVRTAANMAQARDRLVGVDLVILDFDLGQDNVMFQDVVAELKQVAPILLCSGVQDAQVPAFGASLGIAGYWNKGSDKEQLLLLVRGTLDNPGS